MSARLISAAILVLLHVGSAAAQTAVAPATAAPGSDPASVGGLAAAAPAASPGVVPTSPIAPATVPGAVPAAVAPAATLPAGSPVAAAAPAAPLNPLPGPVAPSPAGAPTALPAGTAPATLPSAVAPAAAPAAPVARAPIARVTAGPGTLPNSHGQIWREYDITPYTARVTTTKRPEQAIVDWILRETGYEVWHSDPLGILSATPQTLRVYHTPQVQATVAEIVDRFLSADAASHGFSLRVVTVDNPAWRSRVQRLLVPVQVQTPGVQAWLLEKEAAALLLADLRRRGDYREHNSPQLLIYNGQSAAVTATRGRSYVRALKARPEVWPGFEPETGLIDEGFSLEFSPLLSLDGRTIDAMIKCEIDQVEKFVQVMLDMPTQAAPRQRTKVEVPQLSHLRFHERFRWPVEQVLVVGLGMVPAPVPTDPKAIVPGVPLSLSGAPRTDMLIFVESKGKTTAAARAAQPAADPYRLR